MMSLSIREPELSSMFYIVDARRQIAAQANMASGKGTEDVSSAPRPLCCVVPVAHMDD